MKKQVEKKELKPKITKISHVCMVVKDIDKAIETYEKVYGIGPWVMGGEGEFKYLPGTTYVHGKQVDFEGRLALCSSLNVDLELIQPLDDKSHYAEFLREHGEGMHHMLVEVDDKEEYIKLVEGRGNEPIFHGYVSVVPFKEKTHCIYHDLTDDLGFISEIAPDPSEPME